MKSIRRENNVKLQEMIKPNISNKTKQNLGVNLAPMLVTKIVLFDWSAAFEVPETCTPRIKLFPHPWDDNTD